MTCVTEATGTQLCTGATSEANSTLLAKYQIEVPAHWNGTLVLYSHGYDSFTVPLAPHDAGDPVTGGYLLSQGYALAGSAYARAGWSLQQAFEDQIALVDLFGKTFGKPDRTIAWGHSLGGMITAGLVQLRPDLFTGALPMCGVVAGGPGVWNQGLDSEFAFKTLADPNNTFKILGFSGFADAQNNLGAATAALLAAQATPQGRARTALSAALADVPGWVDPASAEPAATDYATREANQVAWNTSIDFLFAFFGRAELEARSGGNFSWNTGVDYAVQLAHSTDQAEVVALYAAAGLNLEQDLATLNAAPRIAADPAAAAYVAKYITYNGNLGVPVLTMHTTGDGLVEVTDENAYASVVRSAGDNSMLRQVYVHRAGHCTFSPAETISAFRTLIHRIDSGQWEGSTDPATMNAGAAAMGPNFNFIVAGGHVVPTTPSFLDFHPAKFLRPFDARNLEG
jgi:pimeloyl-ACP methyl ester carboxylesterase